LISYFRKQKFDVIVMNFSKDLKFAAPAAKWAKIPKIVYRRGSAIPIKNSFLNRYLFHNCLTDVLANSEATKQTILHNNKNLFPQDKIKVIYNGISLHTKSFPEAKNNPLVIGNLGRLVSQKGQELLIDIAGLLRDRAVSCKFVIGGDGILMESLKQKVEEKDLGNYVEFLGFIEDSASFMAKIDIFALTSRWEGFGYVMAEAMLAKKPIVAFDISSNPELVFNEENGYLIPFENNVAFADALESLINNELKRKSFGENGYNLVCSKFDFEKNKRMVMKFLLEKS
jgi:glycosyltransferase involved in cell wall biosynthesis